MSRPAISGYPVNLVVAGRRCVVVGRRAHRRPQDRGHPRRGRRRARGGARWWVTEVRAWADEGRLTLSERAFTATDLDDAWLATTATGVPEVDRAVFEAGEARRVWVNSADDPANCSFTLTSVVRQGDLVVTIGTGGRSPALATWLRRRLAEELGPEYATLLDVLSEAREELRAAGRSSEEPDWQSALDSGMLDLIRAGNVEEAKEILRACLSS